MGISVSFHNTKDFSQSTSCSYTTMHRILTKSGLPAEQLDECFVELPADKVVSYFQAFLEKVHHENSFEDHDKECRFIDQMLKDYHECREQFEPTLFGGA